MLSTFSSAKYRIGSLLAMLTLVVFVLFTGNVLVGASAASAPLILVVNGDLWSWTGLGRPLKQLTQWGYNASPVISPNGSYVAYLSTAAIRVDQYKIGNTAFDDNGPQNIWVLELATGAGTRVADQPAGASDSTNPQGWSVKRHEPAWSPDGKLLAWTDLTCCIRPAPDGTTGPWEELVVYDWQHKSARTVAKQLPAGSLHSLRDPSALDWGSGGIVFVITPQPDAAYLYSPDGKQLARIDLSDCNDCSTVHWTQTDSNPLIMLNRPTTDTPPYLLIDPSTGQQAPDPGASVRAERYSLNAPDGITLYQDGDSWFAQEPGKTPVNLGQGSLESDWISIAPDGKQAAFVKEDRLFLVSDGKITEIPVGDGKSVTGVAWSTLGWRRKKQ